MQTFIQEISRPKNICSQFHTYLRTNNAPSDHYILTFHPDACSEILSWQTKNNETLGTFHRQINRWQNSHLPILRRRFGDIYTEIKAPVWQIQSGKATWRDNIHSKFRKLFGDKGSKHITAIYYYQTGEISRVWLSSEFIVFSKTTKLNRQNSHEMHTEQSLLLFDW